MKMVSFFKRGSALPMNFCYSMGSEKFDRILEFYSNS